MTPPLRFGPFLLDSRIAVGGTAEVYLARPSTPDSGLPERLVVKRLLPHFASDPDGRTMFEREATLHAAVTHVNVVTVFHAGVDARGEPYLAMEYIDGVDGYRLLRRLRQDDELLPVSVAVYIAREVLRALESVHAARDPLSGGALGIVHRDVSPSNIYLSKEGKVKLGDFGIARSTTRTTLRSEAGQVLKGKFAYLAPEQVAGDPSDHRADLFSLATVFAEILLNRPLFPGGGQLAILLAIRDCKTDALHEIRPRLPPGLFEVMVRALSRDPTHRFATATAFAAALAPFEADPRLAMHEIAARVRRVESSSPSSSDTMAAVRESARAMRAVKPVHPTPIEAFATSPLTAPRVAKPTTLPNGARAAPGIPPTRAPLQSALPRAEPLDPKTEEYELAPSWVRKQNGDSLGPWTFARLMEALATGQIIRGDKVDFVGRGFEDVDRISEFTRFLPALTATTGKVLGPGAPDFSDDLSNVSMLQALVRLLARVETGVLFAERTDDNGDSTRKELYFNSGKLHHVASTNASELLGEYLVRRGALEREELDLALAVLPRYGGRMGDTLISMGLLGPVDIFRAIREQGRDRVADLFLWRSGAVTFYRGQTAPQVEFPLELDLPSLMLSGLEALKPGDTPMDEHRHRLDHIVAAVGVRPGDPSLTALQGVLWPPVVARVLLILTEPIALRDVLKRAARGGGLTMGDVLRGLEVLCAAGLARWNA